MFVDATAVAFPDSRRPLPHAGSGLFLMDNGKPSRRWRSVVGWNVLLLSLGAALIFIDWEAWIQPRAPFTEARLPTRFAPGVGLLYEPGAEVRWTNYVDFWVAQRANRWGFLDREPLTPDQAERTCHIAFIGDSFVEAREVPVADKFHVRLEELAARALPRLNIATSAYGRRGTGQINQLPFYAEYARSLRPKLVVLVFVRNDFEDNHRLLAGINQKLGSGPGAVCFRGKDRDGRDHAASAGPGVANVAVVAAQNGPDPRGGVLGRKMAPPEGSKLLAQHPRYEAYLSRVPESLSEDGPKLPELLQDRTSPLFGEAVEFTAFALDEFQRRVAADGASLWLLLVSTKGVSDASDPLRVIVKDLAEARGIPVVSQHDYIVRQGRLVHDGNFSRDSHWNPIGHQGIAEALLERLQQRPEVCGASGV